MQVKWGKMAIKVTIWLTTEVLLNLAGLDNLADYGEFLGEHPPMQIRRTAQIALITAQPTRRPQLSPST